jgi:hypothetical protein
MAWDFRSKRTVVGITIQPTPGLFNAPNNTTDLIGISAASDSDEIIQAADPTMTGGLWESPRIFLGRTSTAGGTVPMRGSAALPAANADVYGRILQAAGFSENRLAVAITANLQAGSTISALVLDAAQSAVDDFLVGYPISHANIGSGFQQYSLITDYVGASKTASIMETIVAPAAGTPFTIPACRVYQLGTLAADPPLLSMSVWRGKKRRDYRDCRIQTLGLDMPVANESNQVFPGTDFTCKGVKVAVVDQDAPILPQSILNIPVPALRGGKFALDRVKLGHASWRLGANFDTAAASNANQAAGQDGYQMTSGARTSEIDLNDMNVTDFDIESRIDNQTLMPAGTTWGGAAFNRFGVLVPSQALDPFNPGDRNGFVNLTGNSHPYEVDKSITIAIW